MAKSVMTFEMQRLVNRNTTIVHLTSSRHEDSSRAADLLCFRMAACYMNIFCNYGV